MATDGASRVSESFQEALSSAGLDALLVTGDANQRFLEGWTGSECLLLASRAGSWLVADSRYTEQAAEECRRAAVVQHRHPFPPYDEVIIGLASGASLRRLGFEKARLTYAQYEALAARAAAAGGIELVPTEGLVERLRMAKGPGELASIRRACEAADRALEATLGSIREGMSELELARLLESRIVEAGAEGPSFETIVAFGRRASMPHAVPSPAARLARGDLVLIDFGARVDGYRSDITRTFVLGRASDEQRRAYAVVLEALDRAVEAMVAGASGRVPDAIARETVLAAGYPEFGYGVGHGVGLEIHELPFMSRRCEETLAGGMTITCEPGVYLPGWGGIRIEDSVLVAAGPPEILTRFPRDRLIEL